MQFTTGDIARLLGGTLEGQADLKVHTLAKIQEGSPGAISFLSNPKYEPFLYTTEASAVIVNQDFVPTKPVSTTLIRVADSYTAFTALLEEYQRLVTLSLVGVEEPSYIAADAQVGEGVYRGAFSYIGAKTRIGKHCKIHPQAYIGPEVVIGDHVIIHAGVKIMRGCVIGSHVTLQAGAVIGSDGFGFAPQADGSYKTVPQTGNVILEDHVDVGAHTVIDRATMGSTIIRRGVKLDNLIQIAHNVEIGQNTVIAAQSGVSGSTQLGESCVIGGQVGFVGHIKVAAGTQIGAQSGIMGPIETVNTKWMGSPATELRGHLKAQAVFRKLPDVLKRIEELEKRLFPVENGQS